MSHHDTRSKYSHPRFKKPPRTIVYDNACKLHTYCLNREPYLYRDTQFFVDRFHWKGHVGCSKGYCLDSYKSQNIRSLNSQVNEQANSGLQRIKGHIAYMSQLNFIFTVSLFLSVTNMYKINKISLSSLSIQP